MFYVIKCLTLLALVSLSGCSIARHGTVSVPAARVNWPQPPTAAGRVQGSVTPVRIDHAYSVLNYKHGNKSALARNLTGNEGTLVRYPQPGLTRATNYKMPGVAETPVGGVVVEHRLVTDPADRHYKMPRSGRPPSIPQPNRAARPVAVERTGPESASETLNRLPAPGHSNPVSPVSNFN